MRRDPDTIDRRGFLRSGLGLAGIAAAGAGGFARPAAAAPSVRPERLRLRELGIAIGTLPAGEFNAITDVAGVSVGHATVIRGDGPLQVGQGPVRTGVTAILPHDGDLAQERLFAADFNFNGNGELTGVGAIRRTGLLATPIFFTNTSSVGAVYDAGLEFMLDSDPDLSGRRPRPEPVVGETWADFLNDTAGCHVGREQVAAAIADGAGGPVAEGCVGGGTGMRAYGFKAGIGTASRQAPGPGKDYVVGALVQANHGRRDQLVVDGVPVGRAIPDLLPRPGLPPAGGGGTGGAGNSLLVAIATDAPLLPVQLRRLCKRAVIGMGRTGGISTHGSGDLFLAFSTANRMREGDRAPVPLASDRHITGLHQAVVEAVEEAILNALTMAYTMIGRDANTIHALPLDRLVAVMRAHGRLK